MKIATFNINNVNKRLSNLLDWLKEARLERVGCFKYEPVEGASANAASRTDLRTGPSSARTRRTTACTV